MQDSRIEEIDRDTLIVARLIDLGHIVLFAVVATLFYIVAAVPSYAIGGLFGVALQASITVLYVLWRYAEEYVPIVAGFGLLFWILNTEESIDSEDI